MKTPRTSKPRGNEESSLLGPAAGRRRPHERGVALVVTVIVAAMLALVAVALMQSTTADRASSRSAGNYMRAQLAAEAGLNAGAGAVAAAITDNRTGRAQWNYISGHVPINPYVPLASSNAETNAFAFISQIDPASGGITATRYLASTSPPGSNTLIRISSDSSEPAYPGQWVYMTWSNPLDNTVSTNARYAFWVADDTTKLNPSVMGSSTIRGLSTDPSNVRLMTRDTPDLRGSSELVPPAKLAGFVSRLTNAALGHWDNTPNIRLSAPFFLSLGTFKLAAEHGSLPGAWKTPAQSLENDMALETLSLPVAPSGRPKINLTRLKSYLDSLPKSQQEGNLRYQAVLDILDTSKSDAHKKWGGGDLAFFFDQIGDKYSDREARQFVANLFDVLDEDFVPTCNNRNSPEILGMESRKVTGDLQGHPFIVYAGTGHYASVKLSSGTTRVRTHLALGFANPWPTVGEPWDKYTLEVSVTPSDDQFPTLTAENAEELGSKPSAVTSGLSARSGYLFPCRTVGQPHYSALKDLQGELKMVNGLTFTINYARLIYKSTEGDFVVAVLPGSPTLKALPDTIKQGGDGQNRRAWESGREAYWLKSDPRLHADSANWAIFQNGAGGAADGTIPGPQVAIPYISGDEGDGLQGLSGSIAAGMTSANSEQWYRSASITNHLGTDNTLLFTNGQTRVAGVGLLGFLSVGKPWQTLTLHNKNANNPENFEDWKIFDYIYSGDERRAGSEFLHADMRPAKQYGPDGDKADWPGAFSRDGSINAHTLNWNTWRAALEGVPGITADTLATDLAKATVQPMRNTFDFLRKVDLSSGAKTDFERERVIRSIADMVTSRSRSFTVYAVGEALVPSGAGEPFKVQSRSMMRAPLRVGLDTNTGGIRLQLQHPTTL
jgi:hypothetical protein